MENNDDDDKWKDFKIPWYPFYYNPKDKRLFVPKLVGIGFTFNFGPWASWLIILALLGLPLAVAQWLK